MMKFYFNRINQLAGPLTLYGNKYKLSMKLVCERKTLFWANRAVVLTIILRHKEEACTLCPAIATDSCAEAILMRR